MSAESRRKEKIRRKLEPKPWYKKIGPMQWWAILCTLAGGFFAYRLHHPGPTNGWW